MEPILPPRGLTLVRGPLCLFRQFPGGVAQLRKHFLHFGKMVSPRVQKRDGLSMGPVRAQRLLPPPVVAGRELLEQEQVWGSRYLFFNKIFQTCKTIYPPPSIRNKQGKMSSAKLQDTKTTHKNQLHFYPLTMKTLKRKSRKQFL